MPPRSNAEGSPDRISLVCAIRERPESPPQHNVRKSSATLNMCFIPVGQDLGGVNRAGGDGLQTNPPGRYRCPDQVRSYPGICAVKVFETRL